MPTDVVLNEAARGETPGPEIVRAPAKELRLNLACGQIPREGFEGVDVWKGAKHQVNPLRFPWSWADNSVDEFFCSHFVEHIPMCYVTPSGEYVHVPTGPEDRDLLFAFFEECWRVLKPGAMLTVVVPALRSNRAFQDPTHRRFLPSETFLYLHAGWRAANKLDHTGVRCNFVGPVGDGIPAVDGQIPMEEGVRAPEVQAVRFNTLWNTVADWVVHMKRSSLEFPQPV